MYVLVKGVIKKAAHLYRGGRVTFWDVAAEDAAKCETILTWIRNSSMVS